IVVAAGGRTPAHVPDAPAHLLAALAEWQILAAAARIDHPHDDLVTRHAIVECDAQAPAPRHPSLHQSPPGVRYLQFDPRVRLVRVWFHFDIEHRTAHQIGSRGPID